MAAPRNALEMRLAGDVDGLVGSLVDQSMSADSRLMAARVLWRFPQPEVVEVLINCLHDSDLDVRKACVRSLGKIGHARAIDPLLSLAGEERAGDLYDWALDSLAVLGSPEVVSLLERELEIRDAHMRRWAARLLGEVGGRECIDDLRAAAHRDGVFHRSRYRRAIKRIEERSRNSRV